MRKAESLAWAALAGLLIIGGVLLTGGIMFHFTAMWAGMLLAFAQALVVGLAGWGLKLAREREDLGEMPAISLGKTGVPSNAFRMSFGDDRVTTESPAATESGEVKTLETGFQRLLVGIAAVALLGVASWIIYMLVTTASWAQANPDKPFPIVVFDPKNPMKELFLIMGLSAAVIYVVLWRITRMRRDIVGYGEAVASNFTLGVAGMAATGAAVVLAYFDVAYASEAAAGLITTLLLLQGVELLVNAFRSYEGIEELDQEAVDLYKVPLVPMLSSGWLGTVKILFAQSVGLSGKKDRGGVIARMMPRAIAALILLTIGVSCLRIVNPGQVAVLERLGSAEYVMDKDGHKHLSEASILKPGLHITMPWPIDQLVFIPTEELQFTNVGSELHTPKGMEGVDFQFWRFRPDGENEQATEYITGDPGSPQLLETFVTVLWRVKDPAKFYDTLSHSDFFEKDSNQTKALPIYDAFVQQCAELAVTRVFSIHRLDEIMTTGRREVELHCKEILRDKLKDAGRRMGEDDIGIEVVDLTIKDVHPPEGQPDQRDVTVQLDGIRRGPASAYEFVVSAREFREVMIQQATGTKISDTNDALGWAESEKSRAVGYRSDKVSTAKGEAARLTSMMNEFDSLPEDQREFIEGLAKRQTLYAALKDTFAPVNKIVVDSAIEPPTILQLRKEPLQPGVITGQ